MGIPQGARPPIERVDPESGARPEPAEGTRTADGASWQTRASYYLGISSTTQANTNVGSAAAASAILLSPSAPGRTQITGEEEGTTMGRSRAADASSVSPLSGAWDTTEYDPLSYQQHDHPDGAVLHPQEMPMTTAYDPLCYQQHDHPDGAVHSREMPMTTLYDPLSYQQHDRLDGAVPSQEMPMESLDLGHRNGNFDHGVGAGNHSFGHDWDVETNDNPDSKYAPPPCDCNSRKDVHTRRCSWLAVTILVLSVYSTVLSGIWFITSIYQPRWGRSISSGGGLTPSTASLLTALFAKTIEMSFVTVFVSFVGQVLSRRSFARSSRGMTLAEMTMRNWVVQPGALLTHCHTLPHAGATLLGALTLIASVAAIFYTTASDAIVAPKLKFGRWEQRTLLGHIRSSYANPYFVELTCETPISQDMDPNGAAACLDVQYSGDSYHNMLAYLATWHDINQNGTSLADDISQRPAGTAALYDNTTLVGSWIQVNQSGTGKNFETYQRIINNVTMAMPHAGVYAAATDKVNGILQPSDLSDLGQYSVKASVVSPAVNVMCVNMAQDELAPLVYTTWPNALVNKTDIPGQSIGYENWGTGVPGASPDEWLNRTAVDDVFRWGPEFQRRPPVFPLFPIDFNIITNTTVVGSDSIYILGKSGTMANYTLCQLRSWVSPDCSTQFNISSAMGGYMEAHCEDPGDKDRYSRSVPDAVVTPSTDWKNMVDEWRLSMDLDGGVTNNNASNARILTELILAEPALPDLLPSMAEALAVLSSSTLVSGALQTTFYHYWAYPATILSAPGPLQAFNASVMTQQYTSSHTKAWQGIFYPVLALVFVINCACLAYFVLQSGLVTDYTEPQNLFALAFHSPPSRQMAGACCGAGPKGRDLVVPWRVASVGGSAANHYFFEEANARPWRGRYRGTAATASSGNDLLDVAEGGVEKKSPSSYYKRLSNPKSWL